MASSSAESAVAAAPEPEAASSGGGSRRFRVYTRTGDKGSTSLYNGERRSKDDEFFWALGDVDELNASIGLAREHCAALGEGGKGLGEQLVEIQSRLLDVGSAIATPIKTSRPEQLAKVAFDAAHTATLERWIDAMDDTLPPLKNFILPSGGLASAQLHVARTICRRAERQGVCLVREGQLAHEVAVFLNRLSDYLFVAARFAAARAGAAEEVYKKSKGLLSAAPAADAAGGGRTGGAGDSVSSVGSS